MNRLVSAVEYLLKSRGLTFSDMDLSSLPNPHPTSGILMRKLFFSKKDTQIIKDLLCAKNDIYNEVYKIDFCPFERITGVNWEEMYTAAIVRKDLFQTGMKIINPWFHIVTNSNHYVSHVIYKNPKRKMDFEVNFEYTGKEFVSLSNSQKLFSYGEAKMFAIISDENQTLRSDVLDLRSTLLDLTKQWPNFLKEYVNFIATERIARLIHIPPEELFLQRYLGAFRKGQEVLINIRKHHLYEIIHGFPDKEAIVYKDGFAGGVDTISYHSMTKFMFEIFQKS